MSPGVPALCARVYLPVPAWEAVLAGPCGHSQLRTSVSTQSPCAGRERAVPVRPLPPARAGRMLGSRQPGGRKGKRLARGSRTAAECLRGVHGRRCVSASGVFLLWRDFNPLFSSQGQNPPEHEHSCSSQGVSSSSGRFCKEGQQE